MTSTHPALVHGPVYLDYNTTTPVDPRVATAMQPYLTEHFGNPSSAHACSTAPAGRSGLPQNRSPHSSAPHRTASCSPARIGANNLAIRGTFLAAETSRPHVITQATEHPAVLATCQALRRLHGVEITLLPVNRHGLVDPAELAGAITPHTLLVSIMLANNETGTIQPIAELARVAHGHGVLVHTDAAQAAGKIPSTSRASVDLLTVVGHKMYAPGVSRALYVRPGLGLEPVVYGGGQEHGRRAGRKTSPSPSGWAPRPTWPGRPHAGGRERLARLRPTRSRLADALPGQVTLTATPTGGCPTPSTSASPGCTATNSSPPPGIAASTGSAPRRAPNLAGAHRDGS
jgi:cysteine desulfurase